MEIHDPNYQLKLIEMCDCYLETDYQSQIQEMVAAPSADLEEDAVKYLALAILHTLTEKAQKLSFKKKREKITVTVKANDEKIALRAPSEKLFDKIVNIVRTILHLEQDKGVLPLSLGLRSGQLDIQAKVDRKEDRETLKFKFPRL